MNSVKKKLSQRFYQQDTALVARKLLGKKLVYRIKNQCLAGMIVETEAYLGATDPSCHSFNNKRTPRTEIMFGVGGHCYVYFTYGMHYCLNVVTAKEGRPEAVLLRSIIPLEGITTMEKKRKLKNKPLAQLTNGPAKLCQALGINKDLNGHSLLSNTIYIEHCKRFKESDIKISPRIGLNPNHKSANWPLRFYIEPS